VFLRVKLRVNSQNGNISFTLQVTGTLQNPGSGSSPLHSTASIVNINGLALGVPQADEEPVGCPNLASKMHPIWLGVPLVKMSPIAGAIC
jgi:hypothetical protein